MTITQDAVHSVDERRPASALAHRVTCVWIQTVSAHSPAFTHRKAPHGSVELVCAIGSMPRILGPQTGPVEEVLAPGSTIVGVRLRPEAASSVLGLPSSTLVDLVVGADELWGDRGHALGELSPPRAPPRRRQRTWSAPWPSDSPAKRPLTRWSPRASDG